MSRTQSVSLFGFFSGGMFAVLAVLSVASGAVAEGKPYAGDFLSRSTLTGDWGGVRDDLAAKGVTFDVNVIQTEQGVVGGGKNSSWEYGGRGDLTLLMDTGKMGLWPGGFLTAELEGNWGHAVNGYTGALMPVDSAQIYSIPAQDGVALPALNFAQFLSEYFGVVVGKLDTIANGDLNEFAHGKGGTQFMNLALNVNPVLLTTCPYSTLGAGMIILPTKDPKESMVNLSVLSSTGFANTTGFTDISANNMTIVGQARVRTDFFGLTGHQLVGYSYSNKEFTSLDQRLRFLIETREALKAKGSWSFFYNFDQYLYEARKGSGKGVGIFGRFGASDGNPNPSNYFFSLGMGGNGVAASRPHDRFGIGWYYIDVSNLAIKGPLGTREFLRDEQGFEAYYTVALTPWALLSPNFQFVHPAQKNTLGGKGVNNATVLGLRLEMAL